MPDDSDDTSSPLTTLAGDEGGFEAIFCFSFLSGDRILALFFLGGAAIGVDDFLGSSSSSPTLCSTLKLVLAFFRSASS